VCKMFVDHATSEGNWPYPPRFIELGPMKTCR
jgi:hypothetical protein